MPTCRSSPLDGQRNLLGDVLFARLGQVLHIDQIIGLQVESQVQQDHVLQRGRFKPGLHHLDVFGETFAECAAQKPLALSLLTGVM